MSALLPHTLADRWPPTANALPLTPRQAAARRALYRLARFAESLAVVAGLLLLAGAPLPALRQLVGLPPEVQSDPVLRAALLPLYGIASLTALYYYAAASRLLARNWTILVLVGLALASAVWSDVPDLTFRRSIAFALTTVLGLYLAVRYETGELLRLLGWALGLAALLSAAAALVVPEVGVSSGVHEGAWRGVFLHKNGLGRTMVLGALVFTILARGAQRRGWFLWLCASGCIALVILSRSTSSLLTLTATAALLPFYVVFRWPSLWRWSAVIGYLLVTGVAVTTALLYQESIFTALGKEASLTGRTPLWEALWEAVEQRPWLGYGLQAYWLDWSGPSAGILSSQGWSASQAHNGFLEILLDLGWLGLLTFLMGLVIALRRAAVMATSARTETDRWPLLFLSLLVLQNLTESFLLEQNSLSWTLYVAVTFAVLLQPRSAKTAVAASAPDVGGGNINHLRVGAGRP